jgi:hypothetical protein
MLTPTRAEANAASLGITFTERRSMVLGLDAQN